MIINDDVSFGFTITNLLDDLTKIIILNEMEHNFTKFPIRIAIVLRFDRFFFDLGFLLQRK